MHNHFQYLNWQFLPQETQFEKKFQQLCQKTIAKLPHDFYESPYLHIDWMRNQQLYKLIQTMPKGVLHHDHFDCNQDEEFYRKYLINDPNVYVNSEKKQFFVGTHEQAKHKGFISMSEYKQMLGGGEQKLVQKVSSFTMMTKQDYIKANGDMAATWVIFEAKILNFFPILGAVHLFKKYVRHVMLKFIRNGYQRIQFRALLTQLTQYDNKGNIVKVHPKSKFAQSFDDVYNEVKQAHPNFTVGFVFFGLLANPPEQNKKILRDVCELNWDKTVGVDFVQQQDPYGSLQPYDKLADEVLSQYPHLKYRKVYHCGQTKNHKNRNIEVALKGGSARVGHGNNVVQWPQTLQKCIKQRICFEKCLMSNIIFKYSFDTRFDATAFIFSVGVPISISPDDPGKFGYQDTTCDIFLAAVSYNWHLKHFKVICLHSINHSLCDQIQKQKMIEEFNYQWKLWVKQNQNN